LENLEDLPHHDEIPSEQRWYVVVKGQALGVVQGLESAKAMATSKGEWICKKTERHAQAYYNMRLDMHKGLIKLARPS
jgi:hypothetical protein